MGNLASDLDNREFVGATNPDDQLAVQFYIRPVQNEHKTIGEGRPIFEDLTFVKIFTPGNALNIIDCPARDEHKARFPRQWAHFQNTHGDSREIGTPLSQWPLLSPSQIEELRALKFFTVEQISGSSDANINRVGMLAGMSPYTFRDRAKNFLDVARGEADVSRRDAEIEKLRSEQAAKDAEHAEAMAQMKAQLDALTQALMPQGDAAERRGPGRPRKTDQAQEAA